MVFVIVLVVTVEHYVPIRTVNTFISSSISSNPCSFLQDVNLCERIICKNSGVCGIRNTNGPYEGVCLCRYGTFGDYCELNGKDFSPWMIEEGDLSIVGTLGYCSASSCLNGGACKENVVATTRHAYCYCSAGYNGPRCETRTYQSLPCNESMSICCFLLQNISLVLVLADMLIHSCLVKGNISIAPMLVEVRT